MVPIARRNLFAEKGRFVMSVCGVAFAVLLILIVLSLYRGWSATGSVYRALPGNLWVAQAGTIDPFHSTSLVAAGREAALARIPGVESAFPVYARHLAISNERDGLDVYAIAVELPTGARIPDEARRFLPAAGHISIDRVLADRAGVRPGGRLDVLGDELVVDSLLSGGNKIVSFAFMNSADARRLIGDPGRVSYYLLTTSANADSTAVDRQIANVLPGSVTRTSDDFANAFNRLVSSGFLSVVEALVGIGAVVGGAVIALTTYTATVEKARDFSVLKAIGAPDWFLYRVVAWQSLIVGLAGSLLGIAAAAVTASLIQRWIPEFVTDLRAVDAAEIFGAAVGMSIVASFIPARRLNRIDPAMVFRA